MSARGTNLTWAKRDEHRWHAFGVFGGLNLEDKSFDNLSGVFCIFSDSARPISTALHPVRPTYRTVHVGTGDIRERITALRVDPSIKRHGPQSVTWAEVPKAMQERIATYLTDQLNPAERNVYLDIEPLPVNLPYLPEQ
jgi:hypothetical protein